MNKEILNINIRKYRDALKKLKKSSEISHLTSYFYFHFHKKAVTQQFKRQELIFVNINALKCNNGTCNNTQLNKVQKVYEKHKRRGAKQGLKSLRKTEKQ